MNANKLLSPIDNLSLQKIELNLFNLKKLDIKHWLII